MTDNNDSILEEVCEWAFSAEPHELDRYREFLKTMGVREALTKVKAEQRETTALLYHYGGLPQLDYDYYVNE